MHSRRQLGQNHRELLLANGSGRLKQQAAHQLQQQGQQQGGIPVAV